MKRLEDWELEFWTAFATQALFWITIGAVVFARCVK